MTSQTCGEVHACRRRLHETCKRFDRDGVLVPCCCCGVLSSRSSRDGFWPEEVQGLHPSERSAREFRTEESHVNCTACVGEHAECCQAVVACGVDTIQRVVHARTQVLATCASQVNRTLHRSAKSDCAHHENSSCTMLCVSVHIFFADAIHHQTTCMYADHHTHSPVTLTLAHFRSSRCPQAIHVHHF